MTLPIKQSSTLVLDEYQRNNLLWLLNACGYPCNPDGSPSGVAPFTLANTGDWLGEVALMLARPGKSPVLGAEETINVARDYLEVNVGAWKEGG